MMDKQSTTNAPPTAEQIGKMAAKEPGDLNTNNRKQEDEYTRPPRISFGFELEFLVATHASGVESDDNIPGLAPVTGNLSGSEAVLTLLKEHNFYAEWVGKPSSGGYPWIISRDGSVGEDQSRKDEPFYEWDPVEISSPPMYSSDEAYRLVSAVVRLLTNKLRVRVNKSCGFHVHVGNGPHQLDMDAARNYAALQWASEPVLSTLHCPTRSFARWSKSIRRCDGIDLTNGGTAESALLEASLSTDYIPRYLGRARKLGEAPVASRAKLRQRVRQAGKLHDDSTYREPEFESDDSDFECWESKPFHRPRRTKGTRRELINVPDENLLLGEEAREAELDSESTRRELPPQLDFPIPQSMASVSSSSSGSRPLLDPTRTKTKAVSGPEHIPSHRYELDGDLRDAHKGYTENTWKGVAELLACDAGVHQVASLMTHGSTSTDGHKGYTYNWKGQLGGELGVKTRSFHGTVESRVAGGSLDAEFIVTWIKIQCRMLEWARDAAPSRLMRAFGNLSRDDFSKKCTYDVLDFLKDLGMYTEIKHCQERLLRGEEAWFECMMLKLANWEEPETWGYAYDKGGASWNPSCDEGQGGEWPDDGGTREYIDWSNSTNSDHNGKKKDNDLHVTEQSIHW